MSGDEGMREWGGGGDIVCPSSWGIPPSSTSHSEGVVDDSSPSSPGAGGEARAAGRARAGGRVGTGGRADSPSTSTSGKAAAAFALMSLECPDEFRVP